MRTYQRCSRCVMDNVSDTTINFNENGVCNYCTYAFERMPQVYFPNETGTNKLNLLLNRIKEQSKGEKYDCIMGISGGLDSSYLLYLGYKWGLRILAFHIDDGYNTEIAINNVKDLCNKCNVDLIVEKPDEEQFNDITKTFLLAGLPGICNAQDNIITSYLYKNAKKYNIRYFLSGANFSLESILQRGLGVNASDGYHIKKVSENYGTSGVDKLPLITLFDRYVRIKYFHNLITYRPLDYINYNKDEAIKELHEFSGFNYYGGKHYENILTHFAQTYYLPKKFNLDKRTSHLSSLIISGQISRDEALREIEKPLFDDENMEMEIEFILSKLKLTRADFDRIMTEPPRKHSDFPISYFNRFAGLARSIRRFLAD